LRAAVADAVLRVWRVQAKSGGLPGARKRLQMPSGVDGHNGCPVQFFSSILVRLPKPSKWLPSLRPCPSARRSRSVWVRARLFSPFDRGPDLPTFSRRGAAQPGSRRTRPRNAAER
jgi:hypothetical protein